MKRHLLLEVVALLLFSALLSAQGVGVSGDLKGVVADSAGAVMQGVSVVVVETQRGVRHTASTDASGQYRIAGLSPGSYDVSAAMPGFGTLVQKAVIINVGETVVVDFRMRVSAKNETVEVSSELPVVDTARGSQASVLEQQSIRELPIDRRDYLAFALLTPGASNSNYIASNADFRVKQTIQVKIGLQEDHPRCMILICGFRPAAMK